MYKVSEELFFKMLTSNKRIEIHNYCEDDIVYFWESFNPSIDDVEYSYLVSPKTEKEYREYVEKIKKERPLLLELL
jgi:hypothetical protein